MTDWIVQIYDSNEKIFESWVIEDRTAIDALSETEKAINHIQEYDEDWSWSLEAVEKV